MSAELWLSVPDWRWWVIFGVGIYVAFCLGVAAEREAWAWHQKKRQAEQVADDRQAAEREIAEKGLPPAWEDVRGELGLGDPKVTPGKGESK
jgi:hypothetical protein